MARFLDSAPNFVTDIQVPIAQSFDQGENIRTGIGDRLCASAVELLLPVGATRVDGIVGWLHPAVLNEVEETPFYVVGAGQPVTIGARYVYVPSGNPGDVVRSVIGGSEVNPYVLWGFWRSRYFGPLSIRVSNWL